MLRTTTRSAVSAWHLNPPDRAKNQNLLHSPIKSRNFAAETSGKDNMSDEEFEEKMRIGMELAHKRLVEQKRRDHEMLIFSENGKIKYVDPFTIQI